MYIHLFSTESTYSKALLDCIKDSIDLDEHLFIFGFAFIKFKKRTFQYDEKVEKRIVRLKNPFMITRYISFLKQSKWIYLHLLSYDPTLLFWRYNLKLIKKTTWIIWGTDIYSYLKKNKNIKTRIYESLRKIIIPLFPEISAYVNQDLELVNQLYHTKAEFIKTMYPYPVNFEHLDAVSSMVEKRDVINVMIGNSADSTNCHEEMIDYLSTYKEEPICIYCPLSYGGSPKYIQQTIEKGKRVFGDKFIPIVDTMHPEDYSLFLSKIDIALMNHRRQQALGNITALLYLGRKVYLRSDVTTYHFMLENNLQVFNIGMLADQSYDEFIHPVDSVQKNKAAIQSISSNEYFLSLWMSLFERH